MPVFRTGQILALNNSRLCLLPDEVQRWGSILNPTNGGINSTSQCAGRIGGQVTTCQSIQGQENGGLPGEDPAVLFDKNGNLNTIEFPKLTR
ncbi:hypothetical protein WR25_21680 [Diploscapter pachys]|uniref:Uncharacterized protein n=1 Tax=Diploscapter pachys TaxID=2018661 RepID=A0A2A2LBP4_9BILA|nr:hypothetical protein WR25_21680 [Diploscapter pachys]